MEIWILIGIIISISQSATMSGCKYCPINAPLFLQKTLLGDNSFSPIQACHNPLNLYEEGIEFGSVLNKLTVEKRNPGDDVIDKDLIIYWTDEEKRIITGAKIFLDI